MFLKENLIFDILQRELNEKQIFIDGESKEYIDEVSGGYSGSYYKIDKILKLIIKKKRCKEFIACMQSSSYNKHVFQRILRFQENESDIALKGKLYVIKNS